MSILMEHLTGELVYIDEPRERQILTPAEKKKNSKRQKAKISGKEKAGIGISKTAAGKISFDPAEDKR